MAYPQLEDLCSRKREKVALFLTAENMAGVLAIALPAYSATLQTTFWLRLLILLAACVLGLVLTSEINGLACPGFSSRMPPAGRLPACRQPSFSARFRTR
jgi:hypothetical protein